MQGGPVDELLGVAVECPALDQLEVEVGATLEDRVQPGLTGDHRDGVWGGKPPALAVGKQSSILGAAQT